MHGFLLLLQASARSKNVRGRYLSSVRIEDRYCHRHVPRKPIAQPKLSFVVAAKGKKCAADCAHYGIVVSARSLRNSKRWPAVQKESGGLGLYELWTCKERAQPELTICVPAPDIGAAVCGDRNCVECTGCNTGKRLLTK